MRTQYGRPEESFVRADDSERGRVLDELDHYRRRGRVGLDPSGGVALTPHLYLAPRGRSHHGGSAPSPTLEPAFDSGAADLPLPFWSPKYAAEFDAVVEALTRDVDNDELSKLADVRANAISNDQDHRGHSEGIAVGRGRIITSVQEKRAPGNKYFSGHLQIYSTPVLDDMSPMIEFKTADHTPKKTKWSHAVVGQGVLGKDVIDNNGIVYPDELGMMCPLTHGCMGDLRDPPHDGAPTDLIDRDGNRLSTFWQRRTGHETNVALMSDGRPELQVPAVIVYRGHLYLVALRHQFLYVYKLHWIGAANADAACVWQRIVALDTSDPDQVDTVKPSGKRVEFPNYEAINLLLTDAGDVFMLASHRRWLDTWHIGVLNSPGVKPRLTKVAIMEQDWPGELSKNDLFGQGCAIARMPGDARDTVGFWALPHDYRHSNCDDIFGNPMCTNIYTWERKLG